MRTSEFTSAGAVGEFTNDFHRHTWCELILDIWCHFFIL